MVSGMTPHEITADELQLARFQDEVAYLDRTQPAEDEVRKDIELLQSKDGVLIVAWLWPSPIYESNCDPFDVDSRENQALRADAPTHSPGVEAEKAFAAAGHAFDRRRRKRCQVAARRFRVIMETTARAVGYPVEDLKTHLKWSTPLTDLELDRLLHGDTPFPFPVIVSVCRALQLEFTDALTWVLIDPEHLARRIQHSVVASGISSQLCFLTLENLESVVKKLPRGHANAGQAQELDLYRAPQPGGRYWSLYEALAADTRDDPDYTLAEIDQILVEAGEMRLPVSASTDRSWWAGSGAKPEGRPQVTAWWAAGYRIRNVAIAPPSGHVTSIGFEALPGRAQWLASPERTVQREYRAPGPEKIGIYPDIEGVIAALAPLAKASAALAKEVDIKGLAAAMTPLTTALERISELNRSRATLEANVPDDPNIRHLVEFLDKVGEASRSQIQHHFKEMQEKPVDAALMTNLLTRARRQGWIVNNGTRSKPRWTATRPTSKPLPSRSK